MVPVPFFVWATSEDGMNGQPLENTVRITSPLGFHIRPMSAFAQLAARFDSDVTVLKESTAVNGKSIWELMLLGAEQGSELTIRVQGADAADALAALTQLINTPVAEEESV
jgi:phosphotransferase system HPr (HPr) family protein